MSVLEAVAAWTLACVVAAVMGAWWTKWRRVLPLERELAVARAAELSQADSVRKLRLSHDRLEGGFSVLHQVAATIGLHRDQPSQVLEAIVTMVAQALEADLCAFLLFDETSGELVTQPGAYGVNGDEGSLYRLPVTNEKSSSVRVFLTGEPFLTDDAMEDPRVISHYAQLWRCHSLLVVPLVSEGKRIGVMRLGSFKKKYFTQDHLRLAEVIAEEAVVLVESAVLNRRLSEANRRLSEINSLKDDFVSTVSHEFKTPLTAIKGFIAVLLDGEAGPVTEEQRRFLKIVRSGADRLSALVTDLLDLSKLESGVRMEFVEIDLAGLMAQCLEEHQPAAQGRGVRLEGKASASPIRVSGDEKWLRQLLDNLVSNAVKFTGEGGVVTLTAAPKGETAELTVSDTGIGIRPEDQTHIFEKFYRASNRGKSSAPGTGLGLAIAKFIVDKHEGRIWVESEPGKGSRFRVALPIHHKGLKDSGELLRA